MVRAVMVLAGCAMTLASGPPGAPWGMPSGRAGALRPPGALPLRSPAAFAGILCASRLRGGGRKKDDSDSEDTDGVIGSKVSKSKTKASPAKAKKKAESDESDEVRNPGALASFVSRAPRVVLSCLLTHAVPWAGVGRIWWQRRLRRRGRGRGP